MNLSKKQTHIEKTCGCQGQGSMGERWNESLGLADANYYIQTGTTTKQQGSTVQHRELHSVSCDKLLILIQWKRI